MMTNKQTQNVLRDEHGDGFDRLALRTQEEILKIKTGMKIKLRDIYWWAKGVFRRFLLYYFISWFANFNY